MQDIRSFQSLAHSPSGGVYLYSKKLNEMFVHVHPEGVAAWCDISPNGEKCATANDAVFDTYWAAEHEAGGVAGVGGSSVGLINGQ